MPTTPTRPAYLVTPGECEGDGVDDPWTPIADRLPDTCREVLVEFHDSYGVNQGSLGYYEEEGWFDHGDRPFPGVRFWREVLARVSDVAEGEEMTNKGLDTANSTISHIPLIKSLGYSFVCRYSSHSAWKNMTLAEVQALSKAGISVVNVWESAGNHSSFFTYQQGLMDGAAAFAFAQHLGQPFTAPIYFAVDCDCLVSAVVDYFKGVRDSLQRHGQIGKDTYNVGVYGSGAVCKGLVDAGMATFTWLAQSTNWSGTHTYTDWHIRQLASATIAGMNADADVSRGSGGGWMLKV